MNSSVFSLIKSCIHKVKMQIILMQSYVTIKILFKENIFCVGNNTRELLYSRNMQHSGLSICEINYLSAKLVYNIIVLYIFCLVHVRHDDSL